MTKMLLAGVVRENYPMERRVAIVPGDVGRLKKKSVELLVEHGAGLEAGFVDADYEKAGAKLAERAEVLEQAEVLLQIRGLALSLHDEADELQRFGQGRTIIAFLEPLTQPKSLERYAARALTSLSMELMPRITRAQSMDAISSMASIAGYRCVLLAADALPKMFPMSMTAAGTLQAAKVFVLGAGVAGLQAIATAKRLGARIEAFDIRSEVKDQVTSVGGTFVELDVAGESDKDGYAKEQTEQAQELQQQLLMKHIAKADVVITTAAIPGRPAPRLVTQSMVEAMQPGSVIVDLAAESGGNCELSRPGERLTHQGVTIVGPENIASSHPFHASQMYSRNISTFLQHVIGDDGALALDLHDEIVAATLVTHQGKIVHPRIKKLLEGV